MKKIIKYLSLILIFLVSANMLCACAKKPWKYKDSTWYSNEPNISVSWTDNMWAGVMIHDDQEIRIILAWGNIRTFAIYYEDETVFSQSTYLIKGHLDTYNKFTARLVITNDNIFDNKYQVITLHRKPAN